ncbi:uncharacterized protein BDR25DRAFT_352659 [Lindgomyces ingoldianus]|uniref:Uncharacterized protein n=1 Tax=Lindgomyces ingoldianus TaxID=673940 RepID=A0ACB6R204_9PLEO|nr:uncharacterized protein BDR25DRAFT_352659 [Lindgomyces ingoldianus]KAF2473221.1 hypothetical protein BDR25DRAFT_352659 [Lindgomyces ingoldianus]
MPSSIIEPSTLVVRCGLNTVDHLPCDALEGKCYQQCGKLPPLPGNHADPFGIATNYRIEVLRLVIGNIFGNLITKMGRSILKLGTLCGNSRNDNGIATHVSYILVSAWSLILTGACLSSLKFRLQRYASSSQQTLKVAAYPGSKEDLTRIWAVIVDFVWNFSDIR